MATLFGGPLDGLPFTDREGDRLEFRIRAAKYGPWGWEVWLSCNLSEARRAVYLRRADGEWRWEPLTRAKKA